MGLRWEMVKSSTSSDDKTHRPNLSTTTDKVSQKHLTTKSYSPRNKSGSVEIFPPIEEGLVMMKPGLKYPREQKTAVQEPITIDLKTPSVTVTAARRRASLSTGTGKQTKTGMGKFMTVLKAKMVFKNKAKASNIDTVAEDDDIILELPKEPRFSTSMSPEAQYAMMKGYEDTVYNYLCKRYPENRFVLKRNKTPLSKVDIKQQDNGQHYKKDSQEECQDPRQDGSGFEENHSISADSSSASPVSGSSFTFPSSSSARLTRRASMPATCIIQNSSPKTIRSNSVTSWPLDSTISRAKSLPNVIPLQKQLVLSYRLQSAMDILDTVRSGLGHNYTSPRVKAQSTKIKPVVDYNKWTSVWGREFNVQD